jgi:hypothetical protein
MDARIQDFLAQVQSLDGNSSSIHDGVSRHLAACENQFREAEPDIRGKDTAAQMCRILCRMYVDLEIERWWGTPIATHFQIIRTLIDEPASLPS